MPAYEMLERGLNKPDKLPSCSDCGYIGVKCPSCVGSSEKLIICEECGEPTTVDVNYKQTKCPSCLDVDPSEIIRELHKKTRKPTEGQGDNSLFYWKTVLPKVLRSSLVRI